MTVGRLVQLAQSPASLAVGAFLIGGAVGAAGATDASLHVVSQAGRAFRPTEVRIKRGESVHILNDDGDLLHHVYIDSDRMNFDSGDQKPGSRTIITFPTPGDFAVLCAIHPKMRLLVRVQ